MVSNQLAVILGTLALVGSALVIGLCLVATAWSAIRGNGRMARLAAGTAGGLTGLYGLVWLGASLISRDRIMGAGAEKYFCEIDCHLAYAVVSARPVEQVPGVTGRVWAIELRTRFDETTISPRRGKEAPLWPSPRRVVLRDSTGRTHEPMRGAEGWLRGQGRQSAPLSQALRPGESYTTTLLFELERGSTPAQLLVEDADWIEALVIGSEVSPWHGKVLLPVPTRST